MLTSSRSFTKHKAVSQLTVGRRKGSLRKAAARTRDELWQAIGRLLASLPSAECDNYLNHCGYGTN
jgi:hypothetical protein